MSTPNGRVNTVAGNSACRGRVARMHARSERRAIAHFAALCENVRMPLEETHDREAARTRIFDAAQTLATALRACNESERWEPLRDLILAGLQAGGLGHAEAAGTASSELAAAALDARRQLSD